MLGRDRDRKNGNFLSALGEHRLFLVLALAAFLVLVLFALWSLLFSSMPGGLALLYKCGFFFAVALCVVAVVAFRKELANNPEKPFLVILLAVTSLSSWVYDTNEVSWDVESHFYFMLEYSDVDRTYDFTEAADGICTRSLDREHLDESRLGIVDQAVESPNGAITFANIAILLDGDALETRDAMLNDLDLIADDEGQQAYGSLARIYKRIASLPASLVYGLCSLLGFAFVVKFVLAKLVYALIYSLVLYFGMRKLRSGKLLFAVISLYPTAVFLAANYNYDYWVNAWCMYSVAAIVGQLQRPDEQIRTRDMIEILGGFFIGLGPKAVYFPLILLIFLIPKSKFASKKSCYAFRLIGTLTTVLVVLSFALPMSSSQTLSSGDARGGSDVNTAGQISFILSDPLNYVRICLNYMLSFLSFTNAKNYIALFGYLGAGPEIIWNTILVVTGFVTLTDTRSDTALMRRWPVRIFVLLIVVVTLVFAISALYISFTPVGYETVNGFQGRYILPLLFPFLAFISIKGLSWPKQENAQRAYSASVLVLMAACNFFMIWSMYVGSMF